jgi:Protein of unknown function (DUF3106)
MTFRGNFGACGATGEPRLIHVPNCAGMLLRACRRVQIGRNRLLFAAAISALMPAGLLAQPQHSSPPAPPHTSPQAPHPASTSHSSTGHQANNQHPPTGQQHLGEWMQKNQGLTPDGQIKRLQQERGFSQLTPQQQQNATNRLRELNQMPPEQRQRRLEQVENMERLSPQKQEQVRASARQLGQMPPDRQQAVKDAIRNLRNVPPGLRESELNSKYGSQFSPQERGVVGNLLSVESYHPPPPPPR